MSREILKIIHGVILALGLPRPVAVWSTAEKIAVRILRGERPESIPVRREAGKRLIGMLVERKQANEALNRLNEELEQRGRERTKELERRNYELEQMNKVFVGRELRMDELKKKIRELEKRTAEKGDNQ